jgi:hypothetical protein
MRRDERRPACVPRPVVALLLMSLVTQVALHYHQPAVPARAEQMPRPPRIDIVRAMSFGEDIVAAKLAMLWLQSFDNQPGISIPLAALDYTKVVEWLALILALDPNAHYPLLAASRIYAEVPDVDKQRAMLEFVEREFRRDPDARWPWMAHAVYIAKHRIGDIELALRYARTLSRYATGAAVPNWAKQMDIFVLEDMGELESAKVLLGGLLDSGRITDPHERWFLSRRLADLEARLGADPGSK